MEATNFPNDSSAETIEARQPTELVASEPEPLPVASSSKRQQRYAHGNRLGNANYTHEETMALLDLVEQY